MYQEEYKGDLKKTNLTARAMSARNCNDARRPNEHAIGL